MTVIKWRDLTSSKSRVERSPFTWAEVPPPSNLYDVLEVSPRASPEVIKAAYRVLMEKYHPDKHPEHRRAWAEEISRWLNAAYAILSNPQKRSKYDFDNGIARGA